ncbi:MAG: tRNA (N(6)-L-threonylcarbamoyladenosine(37)-C(2))-methylthiotransferase MtaB [Deltaproteobacteria bacterium]|nr:tRNA (N(6)-L-threonylcarbamoyladenosine(37)-C(2))-methylthiotransferase MtaB [Deltaproteobacteria bacterium]
MRRRVKVLTVGCKANFADSASIAREAVSAGFDVVPPTEPADVVIVNSCTVTHRADRDSRALVRRARRDHPDASIVMTGCYAESAPEAKASIPEADHWIGAGNPGALKSLLEEISGECRLNEPGGDYAAGKPRLSEFAADLLLGHRRTFLKIQDGCDFACAYCIVPLVRGGNRSLPENEIVEKAAAAERDGARELVLTGIHIGLYGADRGERDGLADLVRLLLRETSLARLRLSSVEPMEVTDSLISAIAGSPRICRHLHIPLQSGCDRILSRMRRPYDASRFSETAARAAGILPGVRIGADVIAGFPGETREDFDETVRFLSGVPVNYLHVFPYSQRAGTESAKWKDDVSPREKKERVAELLRVDAEKRAGFLKAQAGKELEVLAETAHPGRGELSGYSGNYLEVAFPGDRSGIGGLFRVRAGRIRGKCLIGERMDMTSDPLHPMQARSGKVLRRGPE